MGLRLLPAPPLTQALGAPTTGHPRNMRDPTCTEDHPSWANVKHSLVWVRQPLGPEEPAALTDHVRVGPIPTGGFSPSFWFQLLPILPWNLTFQQACRTFSGPPPGAAKDC